MNNITKVQKWDRGERFSNKLTLISLLGRICLHIIHQNNLHFVLCLFLFFYVLIFVFVVVCCFDLGVFVVCFVCLFLFVSLASTKCLSSLKTLLPLEVLKEVGIGNFLIQLSHRIYVCLYLVKTVLPVTDENWSTEMILKF